MADGALDHDTGFQEGEHQPKDLAIRDTVAYPFHQHMMIDGVEAALDVPFYHPAILGGAARCGVQMTLEVRQRIMGAPAGPEAV